MPLCFAEVVQLMRPCSSGWGGPSKRRGKSSTVDAKGAPKHDASRYRAELATPSRRTFLGFQQSLRGGLVLAQRRGANVGLIGAAYHSGFDEALLHFKLNGEPASQAQRRAMSRWAPGRNTGDVVAKVFQTQSERGCLIAVPPRDDSDGLDLHCILLGRTLRECRRGGAAADRPPPLLLQLDAPQPDVDSILGAPIPCASPALAPRSIRAVAALSSHASLFRERGPADEAVLEWLGAPPSKRRGKSSAVNAKGAPKHDASRRGAELATPLRRTSRGVRRSLCGGLASVRCRGANVGFIDTVYHSGFDETILLLKLEGEPASQTQRRAMSRWAPGRNTGDVVAKVFQTQSERGCLIVVPPRDDSDGLDLHCILLGRTLRECRRGGAAADRPPPLLLQLDAPQPDVDSILGARIPCASPALAPRSIRAVAALSSHASLFRERGPADQAVLER
ncbi:unnamed protein product, partial [Prorocentrum cordatum]